MFKGNLLLPVEDSRHVLVDGAPGVDVEVRDYASLLCVLALQNGIEDCVRVVSEPFVVGLYPVNGAVSLVL